LHRDLKDIQEKSESVSSRAAVGMGIPIGITMVWGVYGDCKESPWVCGNSVGFLNGCEIKRKRVKYDCDKNGRF